MADDVKVKFGGDFTDVSKGAESATAKAGGALSAWYNDFTKSTMASLTAAVALSALFGKLVENMMATSKYAKEVDDAFKRFGKGTGSDEFQRVAKYGQEVGVSMEAVGRTMNYFAKVTDAAAKGSVQHRNALIGLKFTEDEISSGRISAIEVLARMSDEYDRTGLEALSAQRAVQLFGTQGEQLSAIYKNGRHNLVAFTEATKTMGDAQIEALAKTERRIERFKEGMKGVGAVIMEQLGKESAWFEGKGVANEVFKGTYGETGGTEEQEARSISGQIFGELKGDRDAVTAAIDRLKGIETSFFSSEKESRTAKLAQEGLYALLKKAEEKPKEDKKETGPPLLNNVRAMAVSSLQEIGGGDVSSVLSGTYQTSMLDAATKTAENTSKLAEDAGKAPQAKPTNIAK
jgi:uncharacterized protein YodC (DUF2158 family)